MIAEVGQFALIFGFGLSLLQMAVAAMALRGHAQTLSSTLRRLSYFQLLAVAFSFTALVAVFLQSDFSVLLVAEHSHSTKPWLFKFAGTWGNHEGSILLWLLILTLFGAWGAASCRTNGLTLHAQTWTLLTQAALVAMFSAFIIWTSNPFERIFPVPLNGSDLNPLLQDVGLALHPPLLYVGYVGFSIVFAFAIGGLMTGQVDRIWAQAVRPLALGAWAMLTGGIAMGSWWASYELGWGGWWFWDPVENLSLMPWLTGTALIHSLLALAKRDVLRAWTVFLALMTFAASMIGTFVVRSGVLTSVHSFAVDPARGSFILAIAVLSIGAAFTIFALKAPRLPDGGRYDTLTAENAMVVNNLLLCSAFMTVFIGTFYPVLAELGGGGRPSVGPPFYAATFNPMMLMLMAAMALGPLLYWRVGTRGGRLAKSLPALVIGALVSTGLMAVIFMRFGPLALGVIALSGSMVTGAWLALSRDARALGGWRKLTAKKLAMPMAHLGLGVAVVGMVGASLWVDEHLVALSAGETKPLLGTSWQVEMLDLEQVERGNHRAIIAPLVVTNGQGARLVLRPERRQYEVREEATTELDTARSWFVNFWLTDVFGTLGQPTETGRVVVKIVFRPLQILLWIGALITVLGALLGLVGALGKPQRRMSGRDTHSPQDQLKDQAETKKTGASV